MKEYFIVFQQDCEIDDDTSYRKGEIIRTNDVGVFTWIEKAHEHSVKICIYSAEMVCDLS